jgi:PAS domain-containing protein
MAQALQASEARYRSVVDSQSELICRWRPDGTLTFVNEAYCRYFDKTREKTTPGLRHILPHCIKTIL